MSDLKGIAAAQQALIGLGVVPGATTMPLDGLMLTLVPRDPSLQSKEIPVEALFSKLTSMRDKLRVLEQRVNAADGLGTAERAALQAQITATYASFAGFAAFFSDEAVPRLAAAATDDGTTPAESSPGPSPSATTIRR